MTEPQVEPAPQLAHGMIEGEGPQPGHHGQLSRTITESDVHEFARLTGDYAAAHMDAAIMEQSVLGQRVAHGAMLVGFMSAASTLVAGRYAVADGAAVLVSLGYDRIRFIAPVFFGDTVTVTYRIVDADPARRRYRAEVSVLNQHGATVASGINILAWTKGAS